MRTEALRETANELRIASQTLQAESRRLRAAAEGTRMVSELVLDECLKIQLCFRDRARTPSGTEPELQRRGAYGVRALSLD